MARTFSPTSLFNFFMIINLISQASSLKFWLIAMEWPFKWSLPAPLLWQFSSFTKICLEVLRNMDFYHWRGKRWGCAPSLDKACTWGKILKLRSKSRELIKSGVQYGKYYIFFLNAKQFLMCPRQHQCLSWGVKLGNIFSLCGKASCSSVSKDFLRYFSWCSSCFLITMMSFSQSRILLDSLVKFYIYCPFNHIVCL